MERDKRINEWITYYKEMRLQHPLYSADVATGLEVSIPTVQNYRRGVPKKREQVIMLAAMMGLNAKETDEMLYYAKYSRLYALNAEDVTWIFLLNKKHKEDLLKKPKKVFNQYMLVYNREYGKDYKMQVREEKSRSITFTDTHMAQIEIDDRVRALNSLGAFRNSQRLSKYGVEEEYLDLISTLTFSFDHGNRKLIQYIKTLFNDYQVSPNEYFEHYKKFLGRYYDNMNALVIDHIIPSRTFLLALSIHMDFDEIDMNILLETAGLPKLNELEFVDKKLIDCVKAAESEDLSLRDYLRKHLCDLTLETNTEWNKILKLMEYND